MTALGWLFVGRGPRPGVPALLGLLAAAGALSRLGGFVNPIVDEDEAWYHAVAQAVLAGGDPYTAAVDLKPPLVYYWYALVGSVSPSMYFVHAVTLFWVLATAVLIAATVRHAGSDDPERDERAAWLGALIYVLLSASLWPKTSATNAEVLMNLPAVAGLLLAARSRDARGLHRLFASGFCVGLAALFKYQAGLVAPAVLGVALGGREGQRRRGWLLVTSAVVFALGVLSPAGAWLAASAARGHLDDALFWAWRYNFEFMSGMTPGYFAVSLARSMAQVLALWALPLVMSAVAARDVWRERRLTSLQTGLLAALALSWVGVSIGGKFFSHYFLQLLPWLAALSGLSLVRLGFEGPAARLRRYGLAVPVLVALVFAVLEARQDQGDNALARKVGAAVARYSGPGEPVQVWGTFPELHYFAGRPAASRFFSVNFVVGMSSYNFESPEAREHTLDAWSRFGPSLIADLERAAPAVLVDTSTADFRRFGKYPLANFPELIDWLDRRGYALVESVDGFGLWVRDGRDADVVATVP